MSRDHTAFLITEPSWWCRTTANRRIRQLERRIDDHITTSGVVVAQLSGAKVVPGGTEDRTCDRCRAYVPKGPPFWCATYAVGRYWLVMGLCTDCARRESPEWVKGPVVA